MEAEGVEDAEAEVTTNSNWKTASLAFKAL